MTKFGALADELESDFPAVDVTTAVFSRDFAEVGCCVIPQEKVLEIIAALRAAARPTATIAAVRPDVDVAGLSVEVHAASPTQEPESSLPDLWKAIKERTHGESCMSLSLARAPATSDARCSLSAVRCAICFRRRVDKEPK